MKVNIVRLHPVAVQLKRIADALELYLAHQGIYISPPKTDRSGDPPDVTYATDEELVKQELAEEMRGRDYSPDEGEEDGNLSGR